MGQSGSRQPPHGNVDNRLQHLEQRVQRLEAERPTLFCRGLLLGGLLVLLCVCWRQGRPTNGADAAPVVLGVADLGREEVVALQGSQDISADKLSIPDPDKQSDHSITGASYCAIVQEKSTLNFWEFPTDSELCQKKRVSQDQSYIFGISDGRLYLEKDGRQRQYLDTVFSINFRDGMTHLQSDPNGPVLTIASKIAESGLSFQRFLFGLLLSLLCAAQIFLQWIVLPGFLNPLSTTIPIYGAIMTVLHYHVMFSHGFLYLVAAVVITLPVFYCSILVLCVDTWVDSPQARWIAGISFTAFIISKLGHPCFLWFCSPAFIGFGFYILLSLFKKPHISFMHELFSHCLLSCYLIQVVMMITQNPFDMWPGLTSTEPSSGIQKVLIGELIHLSLRILRPLIRDLRYY